ncbi:AI-2E family transporter [Clostridium sp. DL1XJH146]
MEESTVNLIFKKITRMLIITIIALMFLFQSGFRKGFFDMLDPIVIAFAIAYLIDPFVRYLNRRFKIKRGLGILISVAVLIAIIVLIFAIIVPSIVSNISDLINKIPENFTLNFDIANKYIKETNNEYLLAVIDYINSSLESILKSIASISSIVLEQVVVNAFKITSSVVSIILSFTIAIYMLVDKNDLLARIKRITYAFLKNDNADYLNKVMKESNEIFSKFFIGKFIDSLIIGVLCFFILLICRIPFASIIAIIVGISNMIPYFGPIIGAVPACLIALLNGPIVMVWVLIIIVILQQFDGLILGPMILGDSVGVSAFWIIVAVTLGGILFGVAGMLVGVPIVVLLKTLLEEEADKRLKAKNMASLGMESIRDIKDTSKTPIWMKKIHIKKKNKK